MKEVTSLLLLQSVMLTCSWSLDDVCDADDSKCQNPQILTPGEITYGQCYHHAALRRLLKVSFLACLKECMKTSTCSNVSYRRDWKMCDINGNINSEVEIVQELGCFSSNISSWSKNLVGKCSTHTCAEGYKCVLKGEVITCVIACKYQVEEIHFMDCTGRPFAVNAELDEPFGLSRDVGRGMKYTCTKSIKMIGTPFAVCHKTGQWKSMFICGGRLRKMLIHVKENLDTSNTELCGQFIGPAVSGQIIVTSCNTLPKGQIVKLRNEPNDIHIMKCDKRIPVIEDISKSEGFTLLIVRELDTPAGYVKLQLVYNTVPCTSTDFKLLLSSIGIHKCFKIDKFERIVLFDFLMEPSTSLIFRDKQQACC
ncbi:unnamed protein product [Mytilus edulis]|uniref:Sushi domain-containing protein n=1 Tax=Mytilus edulis TaxID=6550 RepID=A0A8S3S527_MYTED|nr:unnamed protein product [Mytilus edulis]